MSYILGFCGSSQSGKTTLLEKVIAELKSRGQDVAALKHHGHPEPLAAIDESKDSGRHARAGADPVALVHAGGVELHLGPQAGQDPAKIAARLFGGTSLVLAEGFKNADLDKIEVVAPGKEPLLAGGGRILALARRGGSGQEGGLPVLDADDPAQVADFVLKYSTQTAPAPKATLWLDGQRLEINDFVQTALDAAIRGMVSSLKDTGLTKTTPIEVHLG